MSAKNKRRVSRRTFLGSATGAALVIGAGSRHFSVAAQAAGQTPAAAPSPDTTLALVNGRIYTMNPANAVTPLSTDIFRAP